MIRITENIFTEETLKEGIKALANGEIFCFDGRHYTVVPGGSQRIYLDGEFEAEKQRIHEAVVF